MATEKDKMVQELFRIVQKNKEEINKAEKSSWITNCSFRYDDSSRTLNLNTVTDVNVLVESLAMLLEKQKCYDEAQKQLNLNGLEFRWFGYTVEEWKTDFLTRISKIQITVKKKELAEYEERLDRLISKELRDEMELADLTKQIKGE